MPKRVCSLVRLPAVSQNVPKGEDGQRRVDEDGRPVTEEPLDGRQRQWEAGRITADVPIIHFSPMRRRRYQSILSSKARRRRSEPDAVQYCFSLLTGTSRLRGSALTAPASG